MRASYSNEIEVRAQNAELSSQIRAVEISRRLTGHK
jgi:hypothetical protein